MDGKAGQDGKGQETKRAPSETLRPGPWDGAGPGPVVTRRRLDGSLSNIESRRRVRRSRGDAHPRHQAALFADVRERERLDVAAGERAAHHPPLGDDDASLFRGERRVGVSFGPVGPYFVGPLLRGFLAWVQACLELEVHPPDARRQVRVRRRPELREERLPVRLPAAPLLAADPTQDAPPRVRAALEPRSARLVQQFGLAPLGPSLVHADFPNVFQKQERLRGSVFEGGEQSPHRVGGVRLGFDLRRLRRRLGPEREPEHGGVVLGLEVAPEHVGVRRELVRELREEVALGELNLEARPRGRRAGEVRRVRVEHDEELARDEARDVREVVHGVEPEPEPTGRLRAVHLPVLSDSRDGAEIRRRERRVVPRHKRGALPRRHPRRQERFRPARRARVQHQPNLRRARVVRVLHELGDDPGAVRVRVQDVAQARRERLVLPERLGGAVAHQKAPRVRVDAELLGRSREQRRAQRPHPDRLGGALRDLRVRESRARGRREPGRVVEPERGDGAKHALGVRRG